MLPFHPSRFGNPAALAGGVFIGALDGYSANLVFGISSRCLLASAIALNPMRMRVQPGSTEGDIGFASSKLDVDSAARSSLLGSSDGRIVTWRDQTANGYLFTNATASTQPAVKESGTLITLNNRQAIKGNVASAYRLTTSATVTHGIGTGDFFVSFIVTRGTANSTAYYAIATNGSFAPAFYFRGISLDRLTLYLNSTQRVFSTQISTGTTYVVSFARESGTIKAWVNGVQDATTFSDSTSISNAAWTLLAEASAGGSASDGCLQEALLFNNAMASTRATIMANQMTHAGL